MANGFPPVKPIGPYAQYCDGYGEPGALGLGYVSTMKLATGFVDVSQLAGDFVLEDIVAYDRAEKNSAYIGQINMGTASSFNGIMGLLWGYDLARVPTGPQIYQAKQYDGSPLPVYSADNLLRATEALFGLEGKRRFPPMPGAYVVCANKSQTTLQGAKYMDPTTGKEEITNSVWCYIAVSITRNRQDSADLFIEDAGNSYLTGQDLTGWLDNHVKAVVESIALCGQDQQVLYDMTFISHRQITIQPNQVGTALTCAPYITLAQDAVAESIDYMKGLTLDEWSDAVGPGVGG